MDPALEEVEGRKKGGRNDGQASARGDIFSKIEVGRHSIRHMSPVYLKKNSEDTPANALAKCEMALWLLQVHDPSKFRYNSTI